MGVVYEPQCPKCDGIKDQHMFWCLAYEPPLTMTEVRRLRKMIAMMDVLNGSK